MYTYLCMVCSGDTINFLKEPLDKGVLLSYNVRVQIQRMNKSENIMVRFQKFWKEVLKLPYKPNSQDNPLHELQVMALLQKYKFEFEYQPNGDQQSPDFRVTLDDGKKVDIECKSSKQPYPTYNGGLPKEGVVYIFSSKRYNETTVYFAEDIVTDKKREQFSNLIEELNVVLKKHQGNPDWEDPRGLDFYIRNMYVQNGAGKKDYFKHSDRQRCENNVLNYKW